LNSLSIAGGEASARAAGDATLDARISTKKSFLMARIVDEISSRTNAINSKKLADETNNSSRLAGDSANDPRITSEKTFFMNLISTEASNRAAEDTTLTGLVNAE
jgi:hypothetical protein